MWLFDIMLYDIVIKKTTAIDYLEILSTYVHHKLFIRKKKKIVISVFRGFLNRWLKTMVNEKLHSD